MTILIFPHQNNRTPEICQKALLLGSLEWLPASTEDSEDGEEIAKGEVDDNGHKDGAVQVHDASLVQLLAVEQHTVQQGHSLNKILEVKYGQLGPFLS